MWSVDGEGLLRYEGTPYVPDDAAAKAEILRNCHDDPFAGHFGVRKTTELVRRQYYWPSLAEDVREYVKTCQVCQRIVVKRHSPYGKLSSPRLPTRPWQEITCDFITGLPPSRGSDLRVFDAIFVVVDRYTKVARYHAVTEKITAPELATLFVEKIFKDFGLPEGIISDRGSVFTSKFWSSLCYALKVERRLSTAFHPQTDGQTERQNQTLEHYLRAYCNYRQDDWASKLALAEFTYNNSFHSSIKTTPFRALYGFDPRTPNSPDFESLEGVAPSALERVQVIQDEREELANTLRRAVETQKQFYDKRHTQREYKLGDKVMLAAKNIKQLRPSRKLADKYLGPFEIIGIVGESRLAYKLRLPDKYKRLHPVFHVSLLEPWHPRAGATLTLTLPDIVDGYDEWEVERILDQGTRNGKPAYLVRWKGWPPSEDTWEPASHLKNAPEALAEFKKTLSTAPKPRQKRTRKSIRSNTLNYTGESTSSRR